MTYNNNNNIIDICEHSQVGDKLIGQSFFHCFSIVILPVHVSETKQNIDYLFLIRIYIFRINVNLNKDSTFYQKAGFKWILLRSPCVGWGQKIHSLFWFHYFSIPDKSIFLFPLGSQDYKLNRRRNLDRKNERRDNR